MEVQELWLFPIDFLLNLWEWRPNCGQKHATNPVLVQFKAPVSLGEPPQGIFIDEEGKSDDFKRQRPLISLPRVSPGRMCSLPSSLQYVPCH